MTWAHGARTGCVGYRSRRSCCRGRWRKLGEETRIEAVFVGPFELLITESEWHRCQLRERPADINHLMDRDGMRRNTTWVNLVARA
jgi:hypothetical protein